MSTEVVQSSFISSFFLFLNFSRSKEEEQQQKYGWVIMQKSPGEFNWIVYYLNCLKKSKWFRMHVYNNYNIVQKESRFRFQQNNNGNARYLQKKKIVMETSGWPGRKRNTKKVRPFDSEQKLKLNYENDMVAWAKHQIITFL